MHIVNKKLSYLSLGLASILTSCDENKNVEAVRGKVDNMEIIITNNIMGQERDEYTIEIYNSKGDIKAKLRFTRLPMGFIHYDDKKLDIRNQEILINDKSSLYQAEKR